MDRRRKGKGGGREGGRKERKKEGRKGKKTDGETHEAMLDVDITMYELSR